jgi:PBP1b-binding outer membrane lipoprotein LpoB
MRKLILLSFLFSFLISCGEKKEKETKEEFQPTTEKVEIKVEKEIQSLDSIVIVIDSILSDIEAADKKLDETLKEIE